MESKGKKLKSKCKTFNVGCVLALNPPVYARFSTHTGCVAYSFMLLLGDAATPPCAYAEASAQASGGDWPYRVAENPIKIAPTSPYL